MRQRNSALAVAVIAATALSVSGCAGPNEGGGGDTTINYFTWNNEANMLPVVEAFEDANPGIKVELSSANNDPAQYSETLLTRATGNQLPDVFHLSLETRTEIIDAGLAYDLTDEPLLEGSDPTAQQMYSSDGRVYGMSLSGWAGVLIYNPDLLAEAGYDGVPTELDAFVQMGEDLKAAGITPYMENTTEPSGSFIPMLGGYYAAAQTNDEGIMNGSESFDTWVPVIEQWQELVGTALPPEVVGVSGDQIKQNFSAGQLAMYRSGAWDFPDLKAAGVNFSTAPFPAVEGGEPFVGGGPDSPYAISAALEGDKLDAATKFLSFLNSEDGLKLAEENLGQVSTSTNYSAQVDPAIEDVYADYIQQGKYYWTTYPRGGSEMGAEMAAQFQLLIQGQATPEDVAAALDAKWNP